MGKRKKLKITEIRGNENTSYFKEVKGRTLIALVISIIVLLILSAVTISALSGDNGILKNATEAKKKTEDATKNELNLLDSLEDEITANAGKDLWTGTVNKPNLETGMIPIKYESGFHTNNAGTIKMAVGGISTQGYVNKNQKIPY